LGTLLLAENEADQILQDLKVAIAEHDVKGDVLKREAAVLRKLRNPTTNNSLRELVPTDEGTGKGKEKELAEDTAAADDFAIDDLPKTPAGEEHAIKRRALQQRLRECYLVLHKVLFLKGDIYHNLGESHLKDEDASYKTAEALRRKLLKCKSTPHYSYLL
jgi:E3 ubiquitin-protein ligase SHPRH